MFFLLFTAVRKLRERLKEASLLKKHSSFIPVDKAINAAYKNKNPYHLCHRFFKEKGYRDPFVYGETSLTTFDNIVRFLKLSEKDVFVDLGCGRGRGLFYLSCVYQVKCFGYEIVSDFVSIGNQIAKDQKLLGQVVFENKDITKEKPRKSTIYYLAGTCMSDNDIEQIAKNLLTCEKSAIFVTVSFALSDYLPSSFELFHTREAEFLWGKTTLYFEKLS